MFERDAGRLAQGGKFFGIELFHSLGDVIAGRSLVGPGENGLLFQDEAEREIENRAEKKNDLAKIETALGKFRGDLLLAGEVLGAVDLRSRDNFGAVAVSQHVASKSETILGSPELPIRIWRRRDEIIVAMGKNSVGHGVDQFPFIFEVPIDAGGLDVELAGEEAEG